MATKRDGKLGEDMESAMKKLREIPITQLAAMFKLGRPRQKNRFVTWLMLAIIGVAANVACAVPSFAQIVGTAQLNIERRGHTATLLDDGKVLIIGGDNHKSMFRQAQIYS